MRTSIDFPDGLYRQLKAYAAMQGLPVREVLVRMVEQGLKSPETHASNATKARALPLLDGNCSLPAEALSNAGLFELLDGAADHPQG